MISKGVFEKTDKFEFKSEKSRGLQDEVVRVFMPGAELEMDNSLTDTEDFDKVQPDPQHNNEEEEDKSETNFEPAVQSPGEADADPEFS